jgi:hypothetical protein
MGIYHDWWFYWYVLQYFYDLLLTWTYRFIALLLMGHAYMIILVMLCQTLVYREVTALFSLKNTTTESGEVEHEHKKDPWSKTLNWYFFAVTNYFLYGESIIYYFKVSSNHTHQISTLLTVLSLACRFRRRTTTAIRY